jgi:hypothetical protein
MFCQCGGNRHAETRRVRRGKQLFWVGAGFIFKAHPVGKGLFK